LVVLLLCIARRLARPGAIQAAIKSGDRPHGKRPEPFSQPLESQAQIADNGSQQDHNLDVACLRPLHGSPVGTRTTMEVNFLFERGRTCRECSRSEDAIMLCVRKVDSTSWTTVTISRKMWDITRLV
jgi:hypothetical protein